MSKVRGIALLGGLVVVGTLAWTTWPYWRPLGRSADDIDAAWARAEAYMPATVRASPMSADAWATFNDVPHLDLSDPHPSSAVVQRVRAWLDTGQPLPISRCDLVESNTAPRLRMFDVFNAANHLTAAGYPHDAVRLGRELEGGNLLLHNLALAIYLYAVDEGAALDPTPDGQALFEAIAAEARCVDEVMGAIEAGAFTASDMDPWSLALARLGRERRVHRLVYGELLPELHGMRDDPTALAARFAQVLDAHPHLRHTSVAHVLSRALGGVAVQMADSQAELAGVTP